jgi:hypothetical protein
MVIKLCEAFCRFLDLEKLPKNDKTGHLLPQFLLIHLHTPQVELHSKPPFHLHLPFYQTQSF